jgi:hypothetical protein
MPSPPGSPMTLDNMRALGVRSLTLLVGFALSIITQLGVGVLLLFAGG